MSKVITIPFAHKIVTNGDGLWSDKQKEVKLLSIEIAFYNYDGENISSLDFDPAGQCGSANIEFDTSTWDVNTDGLIYTDSVIDDINKLLAEQLGYSNTEKVLHWSEQGMQGDDYLNFDVNLNAAIWALLASTPSK